MTLTFGESELWSDAARRDRHGFYRKVRDAHRAVPQIDPATGRRFWGVANYAAVRAGLLHPGIGHQLDRHRPGGHVAAPATEAERIDARQLICLDPPDHTRLRSFVSATFTARRVATLRPHIDHLADTIV